MTVKDKPRIEIGYNGDKWWYLGSEWHREDGPAIEYANGEKYWYWHDKLHREDGPAIEYRNGYKEWYLHGKYIDCQTQEEFEQWKRLKAFW